MKARKRRALFHCGKCKKRYSNPLGHVCTVKTDYRRRSAKARKEAAAAKRKARPQHPRYSVCRDQECMRLGCRAYREGYDTGFAEGMASCPRTHA